MHLKYESRFASPGHADASIGRLPGEDDELLYRLTNSWALEKVRLYKLSASVSHWQVSPAYYKK